MNKKCFVPSCHSNSADDPDKLFLSVPHDQRRRKAWFQSVGLDGSKKKTSHALFACEDHFNLSEDAENWMYFKMMGSYLFLKKDVVPHIFQRSNVESQLSEPVKKRKALALQDYDKGRRKRLQLETSTSLIINDHIVNSHRCPQCSYEFDWAFQLDHHVLRTHLNVHVTELFHAIAKPEAFQCVSCHTKTYYNWKLYEHCKQQHHCRTDEVVSLEPDQSSRSSYRCDCCRFKSNSSLSLIRHTDLNLCKKFPCSYKDDLNRHVEWFQCEQCSYKAKRKKHLKVHDMLKHNDEIDNYWFACTECSYKTRLKQSLKRHALRHAAYEQIDWYTCTQCSFTTKYKNSLNDHAVQHAGANETADCFACSKCSYKTKRKYSLKIHEMLHADDEEIDWLRCDKCAYRTKYKCNLTDHLKVYHGMSSDDNNDVFVYLSCQKCSYKSKHKSSMDRHMVKHVASEEVAWFTCTECSFKSRYKANWKTHMLRRHAIGDAGDTFSCTKCSFTTKYKPNLKKHMLRHATDTFSPIL